MEAIILAGGLGTRLQSVLHGLPKPMAAIGSQPFLALLLDSLVQQHVQRVILSVGYRYEAIQSYFGSSYRSCELVYAIESEPLGTGGAIRQALQQAESETVCIMNGDTMFQVPLEAMIHFHQVQQADLTLALKPMANFDRYGNVIVSGTRITRFEEKQYCSQGNINGGVYLLNRSRFEQFNLPAKFSFETDFLQQRLDQLQIHGFVSDRYFIDIGIPEDYEKAQRELSITV